MPPEDCFTHALTEPAIADVDGDGRREVVAATTENATVVYAAEDGHEQARLPLTTYGYGRPTVANLTDAPTPEIVSADIRGTVVVGRADGTVLWNRTLGSSTWAAPVVADVDADGTRDVLVGTNHGVVLLAPDGDVTWRADVSGDAIAVAQADDDPALEVFATGSDGVRALDGDTRAVEWTYETEGAPTLRAATDGDGDGHPELYLGVPGNVVVAVDANGTEAWRTRLAPEANAVTPAPIVGDLTGDGSSELVATTNAGGVRILDPATGDELATSDREVPIWTFPTVANVTDDPGDEVLVRYADGRVVALEYQ
ncbi:PQQ-binding-like beta-propeller repeat protein [Haloarculaceae archaeon H-GB2-1]|nr:PQQ-binding-like beta-propeller repeat protein [Haloarculaceae archaeon H-GB2-1]